MKFMSSVKAALFDLDGVIVDTEDEYTVFWNEQGRLFRPDIENFAHKIKGYTLVQVYTEFFEGKIEIQQEITVALDVRERAMEYKYIPGAIDFVSGLKQRGIKTAIVTSSNNKKMKSVLETRPELASYFDEIITSESVVKSKPDPEGYLLAATRLGAAKNEAVVFEDSYSGLRAGMASGMAVIALTTTLNREQVAPYSQLSIPHYVDCDTGILEKAIALKFQGLGGVS